jgi:hypothetical protein
MKAIRSFTVIAVLGAATFIGACSKPAEPAAPTTAAAPTVVLTMPTTNDNEAWKAYFRQELPAHMDKRFRRPFTYLVPGVDTTAPDAAEQQGLYDRQLETVEGAVARGIQTGTMIVFGGPEAARVTSIIEESFKLAGPKSLKGVRVVVIVAPSEQARIEAAVNPTEAELIFIDPK